MQVSVRQASRFAVKSHHIDGAFGGQCVQLQTSFRSSCGSKLHLLGLIPWTGHQDNLSSASLTFQILMNTNETKLPSWRIKSRRISGSTWCHSVPFAVCQHCMQNARVSQFAAVLMMPATFINLVWMAQWTEWLGSRLTVRVLHRPETSNVPRPWLVHTVSGTHPAGCYFRQYSRGAESKIRWSHNSMVWTETTLIPSAVTCVLIKLLVYLLCIFNCETPCRNYAP